MYMYTCLQWFVKQAHINHHTQMLEVTEVTCKYTSMMVVHCILIVTSTTIFVTIQMFCTAILVNTKKKKKLELQTENKW